VPLVAAAIGAIAWLPLVIGVGGQYRNGAIPAPFGAIALVALAVALIAAVALLGARAIPVAIRSPVGLAASVLPLWPGTIVMATVSAHGLQPRYLVIEAASTGVWALLFGASVLAMAAFMRRSWRWPAIAIVVLGAFVALVVDSALVYDVAGYWRLDGGVPLPYSYAVFWYPASILPLESFFGVTQEVITAKDFEWQAEHVLPVSLVLTAVTSFAAGYLLRAGRRLATQ
jgi:hypothetical protein